MPPFMKYTLYNYFEWQRVRPLRSLRADARMLYLFMRFYAQKSLFYSSSSSSSARSSLLPSSFAYSASALAMSLGSSESLSLRLFDA